MNCQRSERLLNMLNVTIAMNVNKKIGRLVPVFLYSSIKIYVLLSNQLNLTLSIIFFNLKISCGDKDL